MIVAVLAACGSGGDNQPSANIVDSSPAQNTQTSGGTDADNPAPVSSARPWVGAFTNGIPQEMAPVTANCYRTQGGSSPLVLVDTNARMVVNHGWLLVSNPGTQRVFVGRPSQASINETPQYYSHVVNAGANNITVDWLANTNSQDVSPRVIYKVFTETNTGTLLNVEQHNFFDGTEMYRCEPISAGWRP